VKPRNFFAKPKLGYVYLAKEISDDLSLEPAQISQVGVIRISGLSGDWKAKAESRLTLLVLRNLNVGSAS
jgi:hypothetical protein